MGGREPMAILNFKIDKILPRGVRKHGIAVGVY